MKRKLQRQQDRKAKKQRKMEYFSKKKTAVVTNSKVKVNKIEPTEISAVINVADDDPFKDRIDTDGADLDMSEDEGETSSDISESDVFGQKEESTKDEELSYYEKKLKLKGKNAPKWDEWEDFQDLFDNKSYDVSILAKKEQIETELGSDSGGFSDDQVGPQELNTLTSEDMQESSSDTADSDIEQIPKTAGIEDEPDSSLSSDHVKQITRWLNRLSLKTFSIVSDEISSIMGVTGTLPIATYLVDILNNCTIEGVLWFNCALVSQLAFKDSKGPLFATQVISKSVELLLSLESKKTIFTCICILVHCRIIPIPFVVSILQYFCDLEDYATVLNLSSIATELLGEQLRKECRDTLNVILENLHANESQWTGSRNDFLYSKFSSLLHSKFDVRKYESIPSVWQDLNMMFKKSVLLSIDLKDILNMKETGMWWIAGTRFNGYSTTQIKQRVQHLQQKDKQNQLATLMGMNTEIRKQIFVIIMNSQDYQHATEQLLHLKLKKNTEREIINVICQLIKGLKKPNPFYLLLIANICEKMPSLEYSCRKRIYQILEEDLTNLEFRNCIDLVAFCIQRKVMHFSSIIKGADFENSNSAVFVKALAEDIKKNQPLNYEQYMSTMDSGLKIKMTSNGLK